MLKFGLSLSLSLAFFVGVWVLGTEALIRRNIDPLLQQHIDVEQKALNDYLEDLEFLSHQALLTPSFEGRNAIGKDASEELGHLLHWTPEQKNFNQTALVEAKLQDRILRLGRHWGLHTGSFRRDFNKNKISLEIFKVFQKYDYWDIEKNSPISDLIDQNIFVPAEEIPAIDSLDLIALCKLRLLEAVFFKDYLPALRDVRKLVNLLLTTENFRLELTALSILEAEHTATVLYVENKWIQATDWVSIDGNVTRRAGRALRATRGYLRFWTPPQILEKIFLSQKAPLGFCAAVNDSLPQEWAMRTSLRPMLPFERDYQTHFFVLEKIFDRSTSQCHLNYLDHLRQKDNFGEHRAGGLMARLPYTRKLFGLKLSTSHFEGFKDYLEAGSHPTN